MNPGDILGAGGRCLECARNFSGSAKRFFAWLRMTVPKRFRKHADGFSGQSETGTELVNLVVAQVMMPAEYVDAETG